MQVLSQSVDQQRCHLDLADDRVAAPAQKSAYAPGVMAVIDDEIPFGRVAQQAAPILRLAHGIDIFRGEAVLPHESGAEVFPPRSLRVSTPPLSQPLVPASPIRLSVLAVAMAHALAALATAQSGVRPDAEFLAREKGGIR